jgi:hypothetical protein
MKALIVGDSCGALGAARELGRAGWTVGIGSPSRLGLAAVSRWSSHWHRVPEPLGVLDDFLGAINTATRTHEYEVVFGRGDAEVLALSAHRARVVPRVPYAPHHCVVRGFDKLHLVEVAHKAALSTPLTRLASETSVGEFDLPVVVKARLHWTPGKANQRDRVQAVIAYSREEALHQAAHMRSVGADPLFQECVSGELLHFVVLTDEKHRIVSRLLHLTTRLGNSESGPSARMHAIPVDDVLAEKVQVFLAELSWFGLVDLQFRVSNAGEPLLLDFNGRMYGGQALPNACGMGAMDIWARLATGRQATPSNPRTDVRYQSLQGDLKYAISRPGARRVFGVVGCLVYAFRAVHPIMSWSDPLPVLAYLARLAQRIWRRCRKNS